MCRPKFVLSFVALLTLVLCGHADAAGRFGSRLGFQLFRNTTQPVATVKPSKTEAPAAKEAEPVPARKPTHVKPDDGTEHKSASVSVKDIKLTPGELDLMDNINKARISRGVAPAALDKDLMQSARAHAIQMARRRSMYHGGFGGPETVAMNHTHTTEAVMQWLRSGPHYSILINPYNRRVGVAGYTSSSGRSYYVSQFAK